MVSCRATIHHRCRFRATTHHSWKRWWVVATPNYDIPERFRYSCLPSMDFSFWDKRVTLFLTLFLFPCFLHSALGSEKKRFGQFEFLPILSTNCEVRTGSANIEFFYPNCLSYNSTGLQFAKCKWRIAIFVVVVPFRHIVQAHQNESVWKSEKQKLSELESLV